jgi:outer membrane receptor protein involved in Fe transport
MLEVTSSEGQTRELFRNQGAGFTRDRVAGGRQDVASLVLEQAPILAGSLSLSWALRADAWSNHDAIRLELDRATRAPVLDSPPADNDGIAWHSRVSAAHPASGLSATLYRTSRLPTLNELHRPFRVGNDATDANGALEPETLTGIDLGWRGDGVLGSFEWSARTTLWWNRFDDPIINVTRGTGPGNFGRVGFLPAGGAYRVRENAGRIVAHGLELVASLEVVGAGEQPGVRLAVGLSQAEISASGAVSQLNGLRPAQTPQQSGGLTFGLPFGGAGSDAGLDRFRLDLSVRHEGDRFEDDLNTRSLDSFTALDARTAWRIAPGIELFASGENLTDAIIQSRLDGDGLITLSGQRIVRFGVLVRR